MLFLSNGFQYLVLWRCRNREYPNLDFLFIECSKLCVCNLVLVSSLGDERFLTLRPLPPLVWLLVSRHSTSTSPAGPSTFSLVRAATSQTLMPAQCVSSSANLSLSACLRSLRIDRARFISCSVTIFACAIAHIPQLICKMLLSAGLGEQPERRVRQLKSCVP